MDPRLFLTNVGYTLAAALTTSLAFFVFAKGPKKPLNILFFLMNMSIACFQVSHVIGINIVDPELSRRVLMFNMANIFLSIFICHWIFVFIGKARKLRLQLILIYITGIALFVFYVVFPEAFLLPSV